MANAYENSIPALKGFNYEGFFRIQFPRENITWEDVKVR